MRPPKKQCHFSNLDAAHLGDLWQDGSHAVVFLLEACKYIDPVGLVFKKIDAVSKLFILRGKAPNVGDSN